MDYLLLDDKRSYCKTNMNQINPVYLNAKHQLHLYSLLNSKSYDNQQIKNV